MGVKSLLKEVGLVTDTITYGTRAKGKATDPTRHYGRLKVRAGREPKHYEGGRKTTRRTHI